MRDRKQPTDAKEEHADHHRPEVNHTSVAHWMVWRRQLCGLLHPNQKKDLVAAISKTVQCLGGHGATAREERCNRLGRAMPALGDTRQCGIGACAHIHGLGG